MRGNELSMALLAAFLASFPIPMRGNESEMYLYEAGHRLFPIPMRGNEHVDHIVPRSKSGVSNPHEG